MNRRQWLCGSAAAAAASTLAFPTLVSRDALAAPGRPGANDRIRLGFIGLGGRARWILTSGGPRCTARRDCRLLGYHMGLSPDRGAVCAALAGPLGQAPRSRSEAWALGSIKAVLVWSNQALLAAWGLASWAFQRQLAREREDGGLQFGWRLVDVVVLSLLIQLDDALMSPLTVAFAVLIVASAFWARADQILQTTLLSMSGYIVLTFLYRFNHANLDHPYRHFHYLVGLALLGLMLIHQANRTRALARICGARAR